MEIATPALCGDLLIAAAGFLLLCLCLTTVLSFFSFYCYSIRSSYKRIKHMCGCAELSTKVSAPAQKDMVGQIIANMLKILVSALTHTILARRDVWDLSKKNPETVIHSAL